VCVLFVDIFQQDNASILHNAASKGCNKVVTELLNRGAQIEELDLVSKYLIMISK